MLSAFVEDVLTGVLVSVLVAVVALGVSFLQVSVVIVDQDMSTVKIAFLVYIFMHCLNKYDIIFFFFRLNIVKRRRKNLELTWRRSQIAT